MGTFYTLLSQSIAFTITSDNIAFKTTTIKNDFQLRMSEKNGDEFDMFGNVIKKEETKEVSNIVEEKKPEPVPTEKPAAKISDDGTFYDDEVDSAPKKIGLSNSMRERLIAEASTGLDSESKQNNVILYISVAVAVLVLAGGSGILY